MEGLVEGRIVHYVMNEVLCRGQHRPAVVVRLFDGLKEQGTANLQVFVDGTNDFARDDLRSRQGLLWATSVHYSEAKEPGTWHWIEKA